MATLDNHEHSFSDNLDIIRASGNYITYGAYGVNVRKAIAEAIDQADGAADSRINEIRHEVQFDNIRMEAQKIDGTRDDYLLVITNPTPST